VGQPQSDSVRSEAASSVMGFLQRLVRAKRIGSDNPRKKPYDVICNSTNNPEPNVQKGIMVMNEQYSDFSIIRQIVVNQTRNGSSLSIQKSVRS